MLSMVTSELAFSISRSKTQRDTSYEPAAGDASRPQLQVLEECRYRFGAHSADINTEFSGHYGRKGWWCVYNSRN